MHLLDGVLSYLNFTLGLMKKCFNVNDFHELEQYFQIPYIIYFQNKYMPTGHVDTLFGRRIKELFCVLIFLNYSKMSSVQTGKEIKN